MSAKLAVDWDGNDWHDALREMIGSGIEDVCRAVTKYESENMLDADEERRAAEACPKGCQFMGYAPITLRRLVYCIREDIGFYEDLILWKAKRQYLEREEMLRDEREKRNGK